MNFLYIRELSGRSVVMENVKNELIAVISLRNYPNIPALLPDIWQDWMIQHYRLFDLNYENTIFIHLLIWDRRYNWEFLSYILKSQFLNSVKLQNIVLIAPPKCDASESCYIELRFFSVSPITFNYI